MIEHKPYDHKADVFSFGIAIWELLTREVILKIASFLSVHTWLWYVSHFLQTYWCCLIGENSRFHIPIWRLCKQQSVWCNRYFSYVYVFLSMVSVKKIKFNPFLPLHHFVNYYDRLMFKKVLVTTWIWLIFMFTRVYGLQYLRIHIQS